MIGTVKPPSAIRRPSSIALNNNANGGGSNCVGGNNRITNRITNGTVASSTLTRVKPSSSSASTSSSLSSVKDSTRFPVQPRTVTNRPLTQIHSTASSVTSRRVPSTVNKNESRFGIKRNEVEMSSSSSVRKNIALSSSSSVNSHGASSLATLPGLTAKKSVAGTASARAATTLISIQKETDKFKRLADLHKRQLEASRIDVSRSILAVDGLSVVVKYLTEHLNAFSTPSLQLTIKRQALNYDKLKDDYSKLENLLEQMRLENSRKEDDLKDEIVRLNLETMNEKKRHDNEKNRLFDMFEDQMEAQKKTFKREMEKVEEEKVNLEKVIVSLQDQIKEKMCQIEGLTNRVSDLESSLSMEKDRRCRMLQEKVKFMTSEIQSLKDVLDLKDSELRTIKTSIANEELLRQELASAQHCIANLTQKLEQLEISANHKNAMINMLKKETESLRERYNKEQRERRRISMKNEELEYTLSEITTPCKVNSSSMDEDIFMTPMQPPPRSRLTLASVPPNRPHSSDSIRKARASYSVARPSLHHSKCFQPFLPPPPAASFETNVSLSTTTEASSTTTTSSSNRQHRRSSAAIKLSFQDVNTDEEEEEKENEKEKEINDHRFMDDTQSTEDVFNLSNYHDALDREELEQDEEKNNDSFTTPKSGKYNVYGGNSSSTHHPHNSIHSPLEFDGNVHDVKKISDHHFNNDDENDGREHWFKKKGKKSGRRETEEDGDGDDEEEREVNNLMNSSFGAINNSSTSSGGSSSSKRNRDFSFSSESDSNTLNRTLIDCSRSQLASSSSQSTTSPLSSPIRNTNPNTSHQHHQKTHNNDVHQNKKHHHDSTSSTSSSSNSVNSSASNTNTIGGITSDIVNHRNSISLHSGTTLRYNQSNPLSGQSETEANKTLPSVIPPQSILDSGFEDIEGLIAFR